MEKERRREEIHCQGLSLRFYVYSNLPFALSLLMICVIDRNG